MDLTCKFCSFESEGNTNSKVYRACISPAVWLFEL